MQYSFVQCFQTRHVHTYNFFIYISTLKNKWDKTNELNLNQVTIFLFTVYDHANGARWKTRWHQNNTNIQVHSQKEEKR